jgi:hypothetical protein
METVMGVGYLFTRNILLALVLIGFAMLALRHIFQVQNIQKIKQPKLSRGSDPVIDLTLLNGGKHGAMESQRKKFQIHV